MRRKFLCGLAATLWAIRLGAQPVPARDLWELPIGAMLQPAALSTEPALGLWNPASISLGSKEQMRAGVASLSAASDLGAEAQLIGVAWRHSPNTIVGLSVGRTAISGIVRTEFDPQAIGEVPYNSLLLSASVRRTLLPNLAVGVAARWREGRIDRDVRHAIAADVGLVLEHLPVRQARFALSSFLWRPGREIEDRPAVLSAVDFVLAESGTYTYRLGYSYNGVNRGSREAGPYLLARIDRFEGNVAVLATSISGEHLTRLRSGLALRYPRYLVGVAREEGTAGLGPIYQFTLSTLIR